MKLLTLNLWGGKVYDPLMKFIKAKNDQIDIFCFQEAFDSEKITSNDGIRANLLSELSRVLKDYNFYFSSAFDNYDYKEKVDFELHFGQAIFVKKALKILGDGELFVHGKKAEEYRVLSKNHLDYLDFPKNLNYILMKGKKLDTLIANMHGYWIPGPKTDTSERISQSKMVIDFMKQYSSRKILCGDFNLNPNTKSLKMLEKGMTNLIKKYNIKGTRSSYYKRENKFADYILVSKDIKVKKFEVLMDEVSDHLPLLLEFE